MWWLAVETGSATILAYATVAAILPQGLLGPIAGLFVDRWEQRWTMMGADLFIAASSAVLITLFVFGSPAVGTVIAIIALRSLGAAFHAPASQAAVPMYVPVDQLMRVAGWNFFLSSGVAMAGPVLGEVSDGRGADDRRRRHRHRWGAAGGGVAASRPHTEPGAAGRRHDWGGGFVADLGAEFVEGWRELVRIRGYLAGSR